MFFVRGKLVDAKGNDVTESYREKGYIENWPVSIVRNVCYRAPDVLGFGPVIAKVEKVAYVANDYNAMTNYMSSLL